MPGPVLEPLKMSLQKKNSCVSSAPVECGARESILFETQATQVHDMSTVRTCNRGVFHSRSLARFEKQRCKDGPALKGRDRGHSGSSTSGDDSNLSESSDADSSSDDDGESQASELSSPSDQEEDAYEEEEEEEEEEAASDSGSGAPTPNTMCCMTQIPTRNNPCASFQLPRYLLPDPCWLLFLSCTPDFGVLIHGHRRCPGELECPWQVEVQQHGMGTKDISPQAQAKGCRRS
jgi:hypothetical protein